MSAVIRKIVTVVEETHIEMGKTIAPPTRRAAAIAVIENPFAGRYVQDLSPLLALRDERSARSLASYYRSGQSPRSASTAPGRRAMARPPPLARTASLNMLPPS